MIQVQIEAHLIPQNNYQIWPSPQQQVVPPAVSFQICTLANGMKVQHKPEYKQLKNA